MKFTDTLKELEAKATDGPWGYVNCNCGHSTCQRKQFHNGMFYQGSGFDPQDAELIAYLRNHAQEIINLVEAAELIQGILDHPTKSVTILDSAKLREALAALNKE